MKSISIVILTAVLMTMPVAAQDKAKAGTHESTIASRWIAAWNSHDVEKLISLFTPDVTYEDVAFAQTSHGQAELRKFIASEFDSSPDLHVELVSSYIQGGHG
ncbi:MAG TPA: nuclear transport factor 2 family protein, partial [Terriglobales bacterium]|nr:nuclear transport factor 2 family protein [Terriglobales bacterium]